LKLALLLGMNEGIFPAPPRDANLLTEADRDALQNQKVNLGTNKLEQIGHERYYGYIACTRASERLVLTCSRRDAQDKALNPSPFISHLQRLFPGLTIERDVRPHPGPLPQERENRLPLSGDTSASIDHAPFATNKEKPATATEAGETLEGAKAFSLSPGERAGVRAVENSNWTFIEHVSELAPLLVQDQNRPGDLSQLTQIPTVAALAQSLHSLRSPPPTESLSPRLAERLYGPVFRTSVSAIERFAACPFQFFVHSGLRATERQLFEVDARERGSFQHEVLRRFHEQVRKKIGEWRDLKPKEARELIGALAAVVAEEYRQGLFRSSPESAFAARGLTAALQDFMETIIEWMPDYGLNPRQVELSFGFPGDELPAWEIDLGDGHRMAFRGKIDRVDLAPGESGALLFVVMDYKSSGKKIDPLLLEHGAQIQLPAYLAALREITKAVPGFFAAGQLIPVGAFYVNLRGDYPSGASRSEVLNDGDARRKAYRHTGRFSLSALPILDRRQTDYENREFNYELKKDGKPSKRQKDLLEPKEFIALLDGVEERLREMGRRIFKGEATVDPYQKGGEKACEKCACEGVCRIDPWTHEFRVLRMKKEEGE
jgi:ATP-dependent helicase/nuclease subunit B